MLFKILKEVSDNRTKVKNLKYARIENFNAFKNSFVTQDYPVNVVVPIPESGTNTGNQLKTVLQIQGWILTLIPDDVAASMDDEKAEEYIGPLRIQARKFLNGLGYIKIVDPEVRNIVHTIKPEYAFLDMLLFGVSYTINLPVKFPPC
jgi:hypothetical protein